MIGFNCFKAVIAGNAEASNSKETEKVFLYGREVPATNLLKFGRDGSGLSPKFGLGLIIRTKS
jgi:hypothetical protein